MAVRLKIGLVALLACLTMRQQGAWFSEVELWRQAVAVAPQSPRANVNYGLALQHTGRVVESVPWLARAADLSARHPDPETFEHFLRLHVLFTEELGVPACHDSSLARFC